MLWAFSTADRADPYFFETLTDRLVSSLEQVQDKHQSIKNLKNLGSAQSVSHRIKPQVCVPSLIGFGGITVSFHY